MEPAAATNQQTLWVGKDHLTITEDHVIVDAAHEIPDWQVREFKRLPIFLGDFKFFLRQKTAGHPPFAARYLLERWPDDAGFDSALVSFTYDEQFVAARDAEYARTKRAENLGGLLLCLYPLLGFLWSGTKKKLIPCGFVPRSITGVSIFSCVCLLLLQGTFIRMRLGLFTILFGNMVTIEFGLLCADYALFGLMMLDVVLRFDQYLKHSESPWGFCEWMAKPFRRRTEEDEEF